MFDLRKQEVYPKKVLFVAMALILMGISLLYFSTLKNNRVSNYKNGNTSVVLIDLKSETPEPSYLFIFGISSLILASGLLLYFLLFNNSKTNAKSNLLSKLTKKEKEVLPLISQNKSNKEIADELYISTSTVKTHINNIFKKLNISSRSELQDFHS